MDEVGHGTCTKSVRRGLRRLGAETRIVRGKTRAWRKAINEDEEVLMVSILSRISKVPHWVVVDKYDSALNKFHVCDPAWYPTWETALDLRSMTIDDDIIGCRAQE